MHRTSSKIRSLKVQRETLRMLASSELRSAHGGTHVPAVVAQLLEHALAEKSRAARHEHGAARRIRRRDLCARLFEFLARDFLGARFGCRELRRDLFADRHGVHDVAAGERGRRIGIAHAAIEKSQQLA